MHPITSINRFLACATEAGGMSSSFVFSILSISLSRYMPLLELLIKILQSLLSKQFGKFSYIPDIFEIRHHILYPGYRRFLVFAVNGAFPEFGFQFFGRLRILRLALGMFYFLAVDIAVFHFHNEFLVAEWSNKIFSLNEGIFCPAHQFFGIRILDCFILKEIELDISVDQRPAHAISQVEPSLYTGHRKRRRVMTHTERRTELSLFNLPPLH